jgi:hypothetical protein
MDQGILSPVFEARRETRKRYYSKEAGPARIHNGFKRNN